MKVKKVLIIGQGSIASQHKANLPSNITVSQIPSSSSRICIQNAIKNNLIDFVIICSISSNHFLGIQSCLKTLTPFYCEKPLVLKSNQIKFLREITCRSQKRILKTSCIGFNMRYHPIIAWLKKVISSEEDFIFNLSVGHDVTKWRKDRKAHNIFSLKKDSGGGAISELSHEIDLANYLLGQPLDNKLYSLNDKLFGEVDSKTVILLKTKKGVGSINLDLVSPAPHRSIELVNESIYLKCDLNSGMVEGMLNQKKLKKSFAINRNLILKKSLLESIQSLSSNSKVPINAFYDCFESSSLIAKMSEKLK